MSSGKDRKLMKELLKYPANVFFRDPYITVFQTEDPKAFIHYSDGCRTYNEMSDDSQEWIVRGYKDNDAFVLRYEEWSGTVHMIGSNCRNRDLSLTYFTQKYPSLFDAFEELAERVYCLPLIRNQTEEKILAAIKEHPRNIRYVRNLTKKLLKTCIREEHGCLSHIENQHWSKDITHYAVDVHGGSVLHYIPDILRSPQLCLKAVRDWAPAIRDCPQQTEELGMVAAKKDGRSLQYIKNPTFAMKKAAVKSHPDAWNYIKDEKERRKLKKAK